MKFHLAMIRHGSTPGNEEKRYIGRTQEHLSQKGRDSLQKRRYPKAFTVFSGPMARCLETCEVIYEGQTPQVVEQLREIDFGKFEGKNYQELSGDPDYQAFIDSGGRSPFPGGESREDFVKRSMQGFMEILDRLRTAAKDVRAEGQKEEWIAAVMHGGNIMAILSEIWGGDYYDYQIGNGEGYCLTMELREHDFAVLKVEKTGSCVEGLHDAGAGNG